MGLRAVQQWQDYRERQRRLLEESNQLQSELWEAIHRDEERVAQNPPPPVGRSWSLTSPFYIGFTLALGALTAWLLVQNLTRLSSVITFMLVAVFITLALNPIVEALARRGLGRPVSVLVVFLGFVTVVTGAIVLVLPGLVQQGIALVERAPAYVDELTRAPWLLELDSQFQLVDRASQELEQLALDRSTWTALFGGVLGAAGWVAASMVGVFTTFILTLYLLVTLPSVKDAAYRMVPASRRPGVMRLAEEVMRRVGGYALGQATVATINGVCSWVMMQVLNIPYSGILAVLVGLLGLIPLVGATLGAGIVALVALVVSPTTAFIVLVYYVVYQQVENYWIVPHIMKRTVSVPGAVTVVAVLAGGTLLGVLGALIAIPVAAGLLLLYEEVLVPRQDRL